MKEQQERDVSICNNILLIMTHDMSCWRFLRLTLQAFHVESYSAPADLKLSGRKIHRSVHIFDTAFRMKVSTFILSAMEIIFLGHLLLHYVHNLPSKQKCFWPLKSPQCPMRLWGKASCLGVCFPTSLPRHDAEQLDPSPVLYSHAAPLS